MSNNTICAGDSVIFTDASTGGTVTIWQWDFDSTGVGGASPSTAINQGPHTVTYNTPGTYTIELIVFDGTNFDTISNILTVTDCSPTANFSASQTTLCETDCITFTDLSTGTPTGWTWSFPGGTPSSATGANPGSICYSTAGTYNVTLTVTNQYGLDSVVMTGLITVNICAAPTAGITMNDVDGEICENNCIDFTYDQGTGGVPTTLNWTFPGGTPSTYTSNNAAEVITVCWNDTSGTFQVDLSVSNVNGSDNTSQPVVVHLEPLVNAGPDINVIIGTDQNIGAQATDTAGNPLSGGTYTWTPSNDLSCTGCQNTTALQPINTITYTVTYTDQYGCVVTDDVTLNIEIVLNIGVPSAFSPNGDGSNDFLIVRGEAVIKTLSFVVYNRYGQKVFETTDKKQGWDGKHKGKDLNPGVFVYVVNVTFIDNSTAKLKGNVTLVR
jgi:gliding motility-associated-like protein